MKKKRGILAIIFSALLVICAACSPGGGGSGENSFVQSLDGTKVLSRPASYNFSAAVGENASQYYYNIFAGSVLNSLYSVFENDSVGNDAGERDRLYDGLDTSNYTFSKVKETGTGNVYYLYDSIRFTISQVDTYQDSSGTVLRQELILKPSTGWNWKVGGNTFFDNLPEASVDNNGKVTITFTTENDWTEFVENNTGMLPSFDKYYTGARKAKDGKEDVVNYFDSPYYQKVVEGQAAVDAVNFFQDALEYAVYMFVLGYDYVNANGVELTDGQGRLFDFNVQTDAAGMVTGMTVKGWDSTGVVNTDSAAEISIVDALGFAKDLYDAAGGYVGITTTSGEGEESNKDQIARFIRNKIIGSASVDTFTVVKNTYTANTDGNVNGDPIVTNQSFNRNYDKIISNIIDYACSEAPIGEYTDSDGVKHKLTLDNPYLTSQITDYYDDYFFMDTLIDAEGNSEGTDFQNIAPAEYQSIVIYPMQKDIDSGKPLTDLWLAFEYFDDEDDNFVEPEGRVRADSITIDVGFRFYDNSADEIIEFEPYEMTVKYGKYGTFDSPTEHWLAITDSESLAQIHLNRDVKLDKTKGAFKTDIGNNAINPKEFGTKITSSIYSMGINGTSNAREYYQMNNSKHYGKFGTLNADKFAGANGCDFVEVYFDIHKDKGDPKTNYNFKVGFVLVNFG